MGQELRFVETEDRRWFYLIADKNSPEDAFDWMDYATAFGPFQSLADAENHEYKSDSDTSGAQIDPYNPERPIRNEALRLIQSARL